MAYLNGYITLGQNAEFIFNELPQADYYLLFIAVSFAVSLVLFVLRKIIAKLIIHKRSAKFKNHGIVSSLCFVHTMLVIPLSIILYRTEEGLLSIISLTIWMIYYFAFLSSLKELQTCGADEITAGRFIKIYRIVLTIITVNTAFFALMTGTCNL